MELVIELAEAADLDDFSECQCPAQVQEKIKSFIGDSIEW